MNHQMKIIPILLACLIAGLSITLAHPAQAGDEPGPEVRIFSRIKGYIDAGKELNACRLAEDLAPYKETPTYAEAEQYLLSHGISIDDPLGSYTVKKVIQLQNDTEAQRMSTKGLPTPGPRANHKDAWGRPIRIELVSRGGFIYLVRSAGPDGKYMNDDDYVVGTRADRPVDKALSAPELKDSASHAAKSSLYRRGSKPPKPGLGGQSSAQPEVESDAMLPGAAEGKGGETEVSLDDLLKN